MLDQINSNRIKSLNEISIAQDGSVVYWMGRDQRAEDNWALLYAQGVALERKLPLVVLFAMPKQFEGAGWRQYDFAIKGLQEVETTLQEKQIPFVVRMGEGAAVVPQFVQEQGAALLVTDFNPMKYVMHSQEKVLEVVTAAMHRVDAHNIVPTWHASPKLEYAAYTFRPKVNGLLEEFLTDFPKLKNHPHNGDISFPKNNWAEIIDQITADREVAPVEWLTPGSKAARKQFDDFKIGMYRSYAESRNDPNQDAQSDLSPYLHFGHIAPQRVAFEISQLEPTEQREDFLEELIVRRELSDNFCFYNEHYDSFAGFPEWAQKTLNEHRGDEREYLYSYEELDKAQTHDDLWNAAQKQMTGYGKMHGYLRMYWAKKILEWTKDPETALDIAIRLNDRYELDGRDPNGYAGCAWSIGGVHDRAWPEHQVFGKIRYMNYNGAKRKFNIQEYIQKVAQQTGETLL